MAGQPLHRSLVHHCAVATQLSKLFLSRPRLRRHPQGCPATPKPTEICPLQAGFALRRAIRVLEHSCGQSSRPHQACQLRDTVMRSRLTVSARKGSRMRRAPHSALARVDCSSDQTHRHISWEGHATRCQIVLTHQALTAAMCFQVIRHSGPHLTGYPSLLATKTVTCDVYILVRCRVPDDWLIGSRRGLLLAREVMLELKRCI